MFSVLKLFRRLILPALLCLSLLFNGLLLVSTTIFNAASAAIGTLSGVDGPAKRHADEVARLTADLDQQKRLNRELRSEGAELGAELSAARAANYADDVDRLTVELDQQRRITRQLRSETAELGAEIAAARAARVQTRDAINNVTHRVATRTAKAASRETAAMAGEAIPVWGTAVIVAATALEINDFCQTLKDMSEIQAHFDPNLAVSDEELAVCGMAVPSRTELWETVRSAPGSAWLAAKDAMPTLEDVKSFEVPDVAWEEVGASIANGAKSMGDVTAGAVSSKWGQVKGWWNDDEPRDDQ